MATDWITTAEAIAMSGYNKDHFRELVRSRKIKAQKFGRVWQVSRKSFLAYVKAAERSKDKRFGAKTS